MEGEQIVDKITIKINGVLYAGEHRSDHLFVENFTPKEGKEYAMRVRASDGNVYIAEFKDGKTEIEQCFIPRAGHLSVELCEKVSGEYVALSAVFMFPVFESINDTEDAPPPYEQAKSLAERAIEAADRAERIAENIGAVGGGISITDDGEGNVTITTSSGGQIDITDDGIGNVTIGG